MTMTIDSDGDFHGNGDEYGDGQVDHDNGDGDNGHGDNCDTSYCDDDLGYGFVGIG